MFNINRKGNNDYENYLNSKRLNETLRRDDDFEYFADDDVTDLKEIFKEYID